MYRTHKFHPKAVDSYLSIGDPFDKKNNQDSRFKGKQFITNPPKGGQLEGYFGEFKHSTDSYQDTNSYRTSQPRQNRKLGFGSLDASKRDEFTLDIRSSQYKELLNREKYFINKYGEDKIKFIKKSKEMGQTISQLDQAILDSLEGKNNGEYRPFSSPSFSSTQQQQDQNNPFFQTQVPYLLYDIGRENNVNGPSNGTTPICNKCSRDIFYCKHRVGSQSTNSIRRVGNYKTSASIVGKEVIGVSKPTFSRKSHIKEFYDSNHLAVPGAGRTTEF